MVCEFLVCEFLSEWLRVHQKDSLTWNTHKMQ